MVVPEWRGQAFRYSLEVSEDKKLDSRLSPARPRVPLGVEAFLTGTTPPGLEPQSEAPTTPEFAFPAQSIVKAFAEAAD